MTMTFGANRHADRTNRVVLTIAGVVLLLAAIAVLVVSFAPSTSDETVLDQRMRAWLLDNGTWLGLVVLVVALVAAGLCLVWLRHQVSPSPKQSALRVERTDLGSTTITSRALTEAVEAELIDLRGVTAATATIRAADPDTIDALVDVDDGVRVAELAEETERIVLAHARRATGRPQLGLALECRPGSGRS